MADNSLKKLIDLAKLEGNKFFVLDENGEPVLVMMGVEEYERLLVKKLENQLDDVEQINREILEAQKKEAGGHMNSDDDAAAKRAFQDQLKSEVIDSTFSFESAESDLD